MGASVHFAADHAMHVIAVENGAPGPAIASGASPAKAAEAETAPAQPAAPAGAPSADEPVANGVAHPAAARQSTPGAAPAPEAAAGGLEHGAAGVPPTPPAPPPKDLSPTDKLLVAASPLVGAWGEERYGFSDARVLQVPILRA
jgi:hypothetical protein